MSTTSAMLTNPAYYALTGPHARLAEVQGRVRRYQTQVAPFLGLPEEPTEQDWADAVELVGVGNSVAFKRPDLPLPDSVKLVQKFGLVQFSAPEAFGAEDPEAVELGPGDVPEMVALVALTDPGPFRVRTIECGRYVGLRRGGELVAMAGERYHLPGFVEISGVCTHPAYRGQGLAGRLVRDVAFGIEKAGAHPFLHTGATNASAIRLYEGLGFSVSNRMSVTIIEPAAR
ncbi:GNAT family N-acetyltransferase [Kribbella sp. CA-293567]|uniref:GNAT family N-acetyltransferase n=1 Tax=Kribbella sp. CA-293567 TaxID=3002436 RepID=UPI0022DD0DAE|nr:GNAT family N-acetyltransferase [Kribbella sp. CA-293567]WBQ03117.1 GNAT family N-acetyltransferase [Kribbella sp. CA-293567]